MYNKVAESIAFIISIISIIAVIIFSPMQVSATGLAKARPQQVTATVVAIATDGNGEVIAVELKDQSGNIQIYEFYGDGFVLGEEVSVTMYRSMIIDAGRR